MNRFFSLILLFNLSSLVMAGTLNTTLAFVQVFGGLGCVSDNFIKSKFGLFKDLMLFNDTDGWAEIYTFYFDTMPSAEKIAVNIGHFPTRSAEYRVVDEV